MIPPTVQLPLAPRSTGMHLPWSLLSISSTRCSTAPASTVSTPASSSKERTPVIRSRDSSTSAPAATGTPPPTRPVLPPCGTTGTPARWHAASTAETCCVVCGRATASAMHPYSPSQSVQYGPMSLGDSSSPFSSPSTAARRSRTSSVAPVVLLLKSRGPSARDCEARASRPATPAPLRLHVRETHCAEPRLRRRARTAPVRNIR
mmetsp:Transcript_5486/g.23224  ORF Transcript_5486/g.23224 Transcript_5486/m.23224 type:complete len:205 (-) Transcript_5486:135-749(-)